MSKRKSLIIGIVFVVYLALVWIGAWLLTSGATFLAVALVLTACGATILGVYILVSRLSPAATAPSGDAPAPVERAPVSSSYAAAIKGLITEANHRLLKSPKVGSRRYRSTVTSLPLYILAGAESSGKTSAVRSLGMFAEQLSGQLETDGPAAKTRLANFWFANGAILAEVGGESFAVESEWQQFLQSVSSGQTTRAFQKLTGTHAEPNLRGVVLFCDSADFLGAPDSSRQSGPIRTLQDRLRAIGEVFQCNFPVYVVLSKADKIPFFQDYFGRLLDTEDQQVLGCTLPRTPAQSTDSGKYVDTQKAELSEAFNSLYLSLADKRMTFLAREPDPVRKPGMYEFPRELKRIRGNLVQFLVEVFRPHALQCGPMLRGFYFTAVRQVAEGGISPAFAEGPVHNPFSGEATRLLRREDLQEEAYRPAPASKPRERLVPRWSFISHLFRDVILGDLRAAPVSYSSRRMDVLAKAAIIGTAAICLIAGFFALRSWINNRRLLLDVQASAAAVPAGDPNSAISQENLRRLEELRVNVARLEGYAKHTPFSLDLFLYSGDKVLAQATQRYFTRFREHLLKDVIAGEHAFLPGLPNAPSNDRPYEIVYDRLKAYLIVTGTCPADAGFLPQPLSDVWYAERRDAPSAETYRADLRKQFQFYAEHLVEYSKHPEIKPSSLDEPGDQSLVAHGQSYLNSWGRERRIYNSIIQSVNKSEETVYLSTYAPNYKGILQAEIDHVPGAFTSGGWTRVFDKIESAKDNGSDPCVLGKQEEGGDAGADLRQLLPPIYADDFAAHWRTFLKGLKVMPYQSAGDAAGKLAQLADAESPLLKALFMVHDNARGVTPPMKRGYANEIASKAAPNLLNRFPLRGALKDKALEKAKEAMADEKPQQTDMSKIFDPVTQLFPPEATKGRLVVGATRTYVTALATMGNAMAALHDDPSAGSNAPLNSAAKAAHDDGIGQVAKMNLDFDHDSDKLSEDHADIADTVRALLEAPFVNADKLYVKDPGKVEAGKINMSLAQFCKHLNPLLMKFPFRKGGQDASMADFNSVFAPQTGALAELTRELGSVVQLSGTTWIVAPTAPPGLQVDPDFLRVLNRLWAISEAFYKGQPNPQLEFKIIMSPNPDVPNIKGRFDGLALSGSQWAIGWTGSSNGSFQASLPLGVDVPCGSYPAPWTAVHFVLDARHASGDPEFVYPCFSGGEGGQRSPIPNKDGKQIKLTFRVEGSAAAAFAPGFFDIICPKKVVGAR